MTGPARMSDHVRRLTREEARRIAIRAQMLAAERPSDLGAVVEQLTFLQLDPTAAVAPSADLVAWSRLGNSYSSTHLQRALEVDRTLFEHRTQPVGTEPVLAMVHPMARLELYLADMVALRSVKGRVNDWLDANSAFRQDVLDRLADSGPLVSQDIPDTAAVPWASTGWTNDRNVTQLLEFLASRGVVAVGGRRGKQRLWDLAERVYPPDTLVIPVEHAHRVRKELRLRALGVARPKIVGDAGVPVEIEGTAGMWRLDPEATADGSEGRTALLSPFDRLTHDRVRSHDLFDFEYILEMYKPAAQRRWGYFALPVLHHDRLVGKVDATTDRKASVLKVAAIHEDVPFTPAMTEAIHAELDALAQWLGLERARYV